MISPAKNSIREVLRSKYSWIMINADYGYTQGICSGDAPGARQEKGDIIHRV